MAQIAITALSLADLSQTHWTARGLFTFSLVSSIIAVYYAGSQHRTIGRCLSASQIKAWIVSDEGFDGTGFFYRDTQKYMSDVRKPAASSILSISAPVLLLSASLNSFLAGFGVYLGFVWTKSLDEEATAGDSRNVFLVYVIGLGVCYGIYALSFLISGNGGVNGADLEDLLVRAKKTHGGDTGKHRIPGMEEHIPMGPTAADEQGFTSLMQALHEAAIRREESALADMRVADIYRGLSQELQGLNTVNQPERRRRRHNSAGAGSSSRRDAYPR